MTTECSLAEAWKGTNEIERGVWIERLMQFNTLSNEIVMRRVAREKKAQELGISYHELLNRENEQIHQDMIRHLIKEKQERTAVKKNNIQNHSRKRISA
jgi:hypothetical protein